MITRVMEAAELADLAEMDCWYARKITAYGSAYGVGYDFCQFYRISGENGGVCYAMLLNAALVLCGEAAASPEELNCFIVMHQPVRVEGPTQLIAPLAPRGYARQNRTLFYLTRIPVPVGLDPAQIRQQPSLDQVYDILSEGFPRLVRRDLWMTDTSHMMRHGSARLFTYREMTTAAVQFDVNDHVLVGQVATRVAARGSGFARSFLAWLANQLADEGKTAALYALDIRVSFYREIGFTPVETSQVLFLEGTAEESAQKGSLN